jgi:hypothetical protein
VTVDLAVANMRFVACKRRQRTAAQVISRKSLSLNLGGNLQSTLAER